MSTTKTYTSKDIVTLTATAEGRAELRAARLKPALTTHRAANINRGRSAFAAAIAKAAAPEKPAAKKPAAKKAAQTAKAAKPASAKAKPAAKKTAKAAPKAKAAKPAAPAGYRMLVKAVASGNNTTDTLLVGAYKDVQGKLTEAGVPVTSVKGVYVDDDGKVFAHIYLTGRDGATEAGDGYAAAILDALDADSVVPHPTATTVEGSKAVNFLAIGIDLDIEAYDTLTTAEVAL